MMPTPVRGFLATLEYTGGPDVDLRQLYHILGADTVWGRSSWGSSWTRWAGD